jgi:hypothetical protein
MERLVPPGPRRGAPLSTVQDRGAPLSIVQDRGRWRGNGRLVVGISRSQPFVRRQKVIRANHEIGRLSGLCLASSEVLHRVLPHAEKPDQ